MKWLIASDLHGSAYYTKLLFEEFERQKAQRILLLGDLLYHGPRNDLPKGYAPKEVITLLNQYKKEILCVQGNCDAAVDQMVLEFPIMADYAVIPLKERVIYATHGHQYNEEHCLPLQRNDILLNGHTHIPAYRKHEEFVYLNPGSVSLPKNESAHSYLLLEEEGISFMDLLTKKRYDQYLL